MIRWFAGHPTAANLLLLFFLAAGAVAAPTLTRETFPDFRSVEAEITIAYRGASAADVEDALCRRLWDGVQSLDDLAELTCVAQDNLARATATMKAGADPHRFLNDLRTEVAALADLPDAAEDPVVRELHRTDLVAAVAVSGPMSPTHLEHYASALQDRLRTLPGVADVALSGFGTRQFRIEVPRDVLQQYGLTAATLAARIEAQSLDLPLGVLEMPGRDLLLRFTDERRSLEDLSRLVVATGDGGAEITLGDLATLREDFATEENTVLLDGQRAAVLDIYKSASADALSVLDRVEAFLEDERAAMPPSLRLAVVQDMTSIIRDRLQMLVKNGLIGLVLVVLVMSLFFRPRFALWTAVALPVSFLGAFIVMAVLGLSVNMMTLVAMMMAIGIVMDDSIVIADSVADEAARGAAPVEAAVQGAKRVFPGVLSSFLTTVAVFGPLSFLAGDLGAVLEVLPVVLIAALTASLIEAFLVLPNHLKGAVAVVESPSAFRQRFDQRFERFRDRVVGGAADWAIRRRYLVAGLAVLFLLGTVGYIGGGHISREAMPDIEGNVLEARIMMPQGTPLAQTTAVVDRITTALESLNARHSPEQPGGAALVQTVQVRFGVNRTAGQSGPHVATVVADFLGAEHRTLTFDELIPAWTEAIGPVPGAVFLTLQEPGLGPQGVAVELALSGTDLDDLAEAAVALSAALAPYRGVYNITHDLYPGKPELRLSLAPGAYAQGLTSADLAQQVRAGFLGTTVSTVQVGPTAFDVELKAVGHAAETWHDLAAFSVTLADGTQAPLSSVATLTEGRGWASVTHVNGRRTVTVQASVDPAQGNAQAIVKDLAAGALADLAADHPGVTVGVGGQSASFAETSASILRGFLIGLVGIYAVLSYQFRSYTQPLIVMVTIPLAFLGAVWGHVLMGYDISMPSLVGAASLAGIVVNNAILLVHYIKDHQRAGLAIAEAAGQASRDRFRAIFLSSATTILGTLPLLAETSLQAQTLKPFVISVSFGLLSSTLLVLILLPGLYAILDDLRGGGPFLSPSSLSG